MKVSVFQHTTQLLASVEIEGQVFNFENAGEVGIWHSAWCLECVRLDPNSPIIKAIHEHIAAGGAKYVTHEEYLHAVVVAKTQEFLRK